MVVIRTENLGRCFGPIRAVDRLNLTIQKGEIFGLVGPDGAGKTTILRMLSGILPPSEGEAWILDHPISHDPEAVKEKIGYMAQHFALYGDLTVNENLHFYADLYDVPKGEREARIDRLLAFSQLNPHRDRLAQNLSGGMKQKLGLACALIHRPQILFLDEPTSGVDPVSRRDFWEILYQLHDEGITILLSTAYLDEAERCHRVALIHQGTLFMGGSPDEIKGRSGVDLWVLRCSPLRAAARRILHFPEIQSVGIVGDRIHLVFKEGKECQPEVERRLSEEGIEVIFFQRIAPSLEDVFINLLKR